MNGRLRNSRPPRPAERLLRRILPGEPGGSILGDLHEEFLDRTRWAAAWYWTAALRLTLRYLGARLTRRSGVAPLTPGPRGLLPASSDLRQTLRSLRRRPGLTVISILTLALGIGVNAAIFTLVNGILLNPLPYPGADRIVRLWPDYFLTQEVLDLVAERAESFTLVAGSTPMRLSLVGDSEPIEVLALAVTPGYFSLLGVEPRIGRSFVKADSAPGTEPTVLLGHRFWQTHLGGASEIVGRQIELGSRLRTVIGVLPPDFVPLNPETACWMPLESDPASPVYTGRSQLTALARLKSPTTPAVAEAELRTLAEAAAQLDPSTYGDDWIAAARVITLRDMLVHDVRSLLWALQGAVFFVFLIACANMANLTLARTAARRREMALRRALGASGWRLARLILTETFLLSLAGGLVGILAAEWTVALLRTAAETGLPFVERITVDNNVWGLTLLLSLGAGGLFALGPSWMASSQNPGVLRGMGRGDDLARDRWRGALVTLEVALALLLMLGAGLMVRTLYELGNIDPGFEPDRVVTARIRPTSDRYSTAPQVLQLFGDIQRRIANMPGVRAVGGIHLLPLKASRFHFTYVAEGHPIPPGSQRPSAKVRLLLPGYFESMGIPLLAGRTFDSSDSARSPAVGIINESMARRLWPNEDAVGKKIHFFDTSTPPFTVVGVVGDVRQASLKIEPSADIYRPVSQYFWDSLYLTVLSDLDDDAILARIRGAIWSLDRTILITEPDALPRVVRRSVGDTRLYGTLLFSIAALATLLAGIGIYGVMACVVSGRRYEIGIRVALGAASRSVLSSLIGRGMRPVLPGLLLGLAAGLVLTRTLSAALYRVEPLDPLVFAVVTVLAGVLALAAIGIPAGRALRIDPNEVLRSD